MIKLYTAQICPFAHRARLSLAMKGIEHERVEVDLRNIPDWYKEVSPNKKVPLLEHDERKVWESLIVAEYVDEAFQGPRMTPVDPYTRAQMRIAFTVIDAHVAGMIGPAMKSGEPIPAEKLASSWKAIEASMDPRGPYWMGSDLTLADLAAYPFFERWPVLEHKLGLKLQPGERIERWLEAVRKVPAVQQESKPAEFYLDYFNSMAKA